MTAAYPHPDASSLWHATAIEPTAFAPLRQDIDTTVAIVGGGFTGLSAAHHLRRSGVDCVVVEANDNGWGASGRTGGMAVLRYKKGFAALARQYGDACALRLHAAIKEAVDILESIVNEHGLDCDFSRYGHITAASSETAVRMLNDDCEWLARVAADTNPVMLDRSRMQQLTGTGVYPAGYLDRRAAGIQPLSYSRGLASALARGGLPIYCGTPVTSWRREGQRFALMTPHGQITADRVVLATNAYTGMENVAASLSRRIIPVASSVVATRPLSPEQLASILPSRHLVTDTRKLTNYFRLLPGNRVGYGGRGDLLGGNATSSFKGIEDLLVATFPSLKGVPVEFRWSGMVAVTRDDFPHIGELQPGVFYAMGYGGRGVALAQLMGKRLAALARGEAIDADPMGGDSFSPFMFHTFRKPAMLAMAKYYQYLDRKDRDRATLHNL